MEFNDIAVVKGHNNDIIMSAMASQITGLTTVYSTVYSDADQRNHQSPASLAFVRGIHRWPMNSLHKGPVARKMLPFDDVIIKSEILNSIITYINNQYMGNKYTQAHNRACIHQQTAVHITYKSVVWISKYLRDTFNSNIMPGTYTYC